MRSTLPTAAFLLAATCLPNVTQAQATQPPAPGVYFLWTPPGPQTTTPANPVGPNFNWVAEQTGRPTVIGLSSPGQPPSLITAGPERTMAGRPIRLEAPEAPFLFGRFWYRLVPSNENVGAPDLWTTGTDYADAGKPISLWLPNEGIAAGDEVFVRVQVDRSPATAAGTAPIYVKTSGPLPPGRFGSKVHFDLGPLPAGVYHVSLEAWDAGTGLHNTSARTLVVR